MKSKNLFAVVLASLVVLVLSLPVMAQSTTQSTTTTTHQAAPTMPADTIQTTDTTIAPAAPEEQDQP